MADGYTRFTEGVVSAKTSVIIRGGYPVLATDIKPPVKYRLEFDCTEREAIKLVIAELVGLLESLAVAGKGSY